MAPPENVPHAIEPAPGAARANPAAPPVRLPPLYRNRDYLLLWSGQVVSTLGSAVSGIAVPLLILALTNSPEAAGIAGGLGTLPYLVFSLPAGALVDRWDRRRVMILCDSIRAVNTATIPLALAFGVLSIGQLYLNVLIEGTLYVFFNLAEVAALPQVVAKPQLPAASGQNQTTQATATLIGPALGGFLYQSIGRAVPFVADAISYLISAGSLLAIRTRFQEEHRVARRHLGVEVREGVVWLWHQPVLRVMALITGVFNFTTAGLGLLVIVIARAQHADEVTIGLIFSIGAVGGVLGSLVASRVQERLSFGQAIIGSIWAAALVIPLYALAPPLFLLGLITAVFFCTAPIYSVVSVSYRLPLIPDALQGRVNSAFRLVAFGFIPPGSALTGVLIERLGAVPTVLIFGAVLVGLALAVTFNRNVREAPRHSGL